MLCSSFFFKRVDFGGAVSGNYYEYLGYFHEQERKKVYPLILYFGRDEMVFYYRPSDGVKSVVHNSVSMVRLFSVYIAAGELNQLRTTRVLENYLLNPVWQESSAELFVERRYMQTGYFLNYNRLVFDPGANRIKGALWNGSARKAQPKSVEGVNQSLFLRLGDYVWEEKKEDNRLVANGVNFQRLLLDFLFELDNAQTFEGDNFFRLQPALQGNRLLDAIKRKCLYLKQLQSLSSWGLSSSRDREDLLPITFLQAEQEWLSVCCLESYQDIFSSPKSPFECGADEISQVLFRNRLGVKLKPRREYFQGNEDCARLRNQITSFYMRQYDVLKAWDVMFHPLMKPVIFLIMFMIPFGDLVFDKLFKTHYAGCCSVCLPIFLAGYLLLVYHRQRVNLFKLMLPRLFLGILIGWLAFASGEELWKSALIKSPGSVLVLSSVVLTLLFMYVFTDISNKLSFLGRSQLLSRSVIILLIALMFSLAQGVYVLQFSGKGLLNNSGFLSLDNEKLFACVAADSELINDLQDSQKHLSLLELVRGWDTGGHRTFMINSVSLPIKRVDLWQDTWLGSNYRYLPFWWHSEGDHGIIYVWSILFSQMVMSILTGIVLQLLWEDRPITEPL